jgi:hypothetical protein
MCTVVQKKMCLVTRLNSTKSTLAKPLFVRPEELFVLVIKYKFEYI